MNQSHSQEKTEENRIDPLLIWVIYILPDSHRQSEKISNGSIKLQHHKSMKSSFGAKSIQVFHATCSALCCKLLWLTDLVVSFWHSGISLNCVAVEMRVVHGQKRK